MYWQNPMYTLLGNGGSFTQPCASPRHPVDVPKCPHLGCISVYYEGFIGSTQKGRPLSFSKFKQKWAYLARILNLGLSLLGG